MKSIRHEFVKIFGGVYYDNKNHEIANCYSYAGNIPLFIHGIKWKWTNIKLRMLFIKYEFMRNVLINYKTYRRFKWLFKLFGYRPMNQQEYFDLINQSLKNDEK